LGHLFEELRRGNRSCLILCFEPDLVDNPALNSPSIDSQGEHIHRLSNASEARLTVVRRCLSEQYYALVAKKFSLVGMPGYLSAFPDYWEDIQSTVDSWQRETARDLELQSRIGARWLENGLRNLPHWSSAPHSTLTAKKVYGLGAGPSGTEVLSKLAGRRDQVAIVAGDTAAGWLAAFGYRADIVCSLDCQWYTGLHGRRRLARQ